jgi:hypothetical protein
MPFRSRIVYTLLTGYLLTYFSEWMFWSGRPPADTFFLEAIPTWIAYSFIAFVFLTAVTYFRVRSWAAVFLAGALYGWLLEGVLVQTMYDDFPLNISFTGLAWHALLSVIVGWYWLPRLLRNSRAIPACIGCGVMLGLWSIGWWLEPNILIAPAESVWIYNFTFGLLLAPAYSLWSRFDGLRFSPSRLEIWGAVILLAIYYVLVTVPRQPLALIVLPPLLLIVVWALRKNRQHETEIQQPTLPITLGQALPVLLIPLTASLVYTIALNLGIKFPGLSLLYVVAMPAGFIAFAVSVYRLWRKSADYAETQGA